MDELTSIDDLMNYIANHELDDVNDELWEEMKWVANLALDQGC